MKNSNGQTEIKVSLYFYLSFEKFENFIKKFSKKSQF